MFTDKKKIEKFNAEIISRVTTFLDLPSILQLTLTSKSFCHLMKDEFVFKRLVERDFGITDKKPEESWVKIYKQLKTGNDQTTTMNGNDCPHHLDYPEATSALIIEIKRVLYKSYQQNPSLCDICQTQNAIYLNMHPGCHSEGIVIITLIQGVNSLVQNIACRTCLDNFVDDEEHYPIQLELDTGNLYCFQCTQGQPYKVNFITCIVRIAYRSL